MFSKASRNTSSDNATRPANRSATPSIVAADMRLTGDLVSDGELQIDGFVDGDIRCRTLVVGEGGSLHGEVRAERVRIHGTVDGFVTAKSVFLASTAHMVGDISHESLAIEPGAFMDGRCKRLEEETLMLADDTLPLAEAKAKLNEKQIEDASDHDAPVGAAYQPG